MHIDSPHGRGLDLGSGPSRLMGVVNVTPDSFSDGGSYLAPEAAVAHGVALVEAGADILDLGAESTRPGYVPVAPQAQLDRLLPVLEGLRAAVDVPISIDTTRASVAEGAIRAGADWINDTTAFGEDPGLADVAARTSAPVVLMHRFDPPRTAADAPPGRESVMAPIVARLRERIEFAEARGIDRSRIMLDPGIGFGTTPDDNWVIHAHVTDLAELGCPLVVGPSRKSFLGHTTGREVGDRLVATAACVAVLALAGVEIIRVHDVAEMADVVAVTRAVREATAK